MVSVRLRKGPAKSTSTPFFLWSVRNGLLLVVVLQVLYIGRKQQLASSSSSSKQKHTTATTNQLLDPQAWKQEQVRRTPKENPVPVVKLGNAVPLQHEDDPLSDHDDQHHHPAAGHEQHHPAESVDEPDAQDDFDSSKEKKKKSKTAIVAAVQAADGLIRVAAKEGTGPTSLGFVVDLVHERAHPPFRSSSIAGMLDDYYTKLQATVADKLPSQSLLKACEYTAAPVRDSNSELLLQRAHCRDSDVVLYAYNDATFSRSLCGQLVEPGALIKLVSDDDVCQEAVHLFPVDFPPITGHGMPEITIRRHPPTDSSTLKLETVQCDIPCQAQVVAHDNQNENDNEYRYIDDWKILTSTKDPYFHENVKVERTAYRSDLYYSTTSLISSVPLSFYDADQHSLRNRPALNWETAADQATYVLDDHCNIVSGGPARRQKWVAALQAIFPVAAYGKCHHNTDLSNSETTTTAQGRIALSKRNRIHLAFEAGVEKDHVTPVVWEAMLSGAVPAVLGATNLERILPPHSFLDASHFNSWDKFAEHVKTVSQNKTLWESYHTWRTNETMLKGFEKRFAFTQTNPECRMCKWAYAKRYGLGWNHAQQVVQETRIPRRLCTASDSSLVTRPFRETWLFHGSGHSVSAPGTASDTCTSLTVESTVTGGGFQVERRIQQHDGVTDIVISSVTREAGESSSNEEGDIILRLEVDVKNLEGAYFPNTHTLVPTVRSAVVSSASVQDSLSKVTVLANWVTDIRSPQRGILEVVVDRKGIKLHPDQTRRIRVITEDASELHDKITEFFPTSFGKLMTKDFVDPLQFFYDAS